MISFSVRILRMYGKASEECDDRDMEKRTAVRRDDRADFCWRRAFRLGWAEIG